MKLFNMIVANNHFKLISKIITNSPMPPSYNVHASWLLANNWDQHLILSKQIQYREIAIIEQKR